MTPRRSLFAWLWRDYLRPHKVLLIFAVMLMAIEGSMLGLLSRMIQPMFDTVFLQGSENALWVVGLSIMGIFFVRAVSSAGQRILMVRVSQLAAAGMRRHLLRHLMTLDSGYHQVNPPGQLIERVQGDVTVVNQIWAAILVGIGRDLVAVVFSFFRGADGRLALDRRGAGWHSVSGAALTFGTGLRPPPFSRGARDCGAHVHTA